MGEYAYLVMMDIPAELEEAYVLGYDAVLIIHGHRHGFTLGNYIRTKLKKHLRKFTDIGFVEIECHQPGCTVIRYMRNN